MAKSSFYEAGRSLLDAGQDKLPWQVSAGVILVFSVVWWVVVLSAIVAFFNVIT